MARSARYTRAIAAGAALVALASACGSEDDTNDGAAARTTAATTGATSPAATSPAGSPTAAPTSPAAETPAVAIKNIAMLTPLGTDPFFQACSKAAKDTAKELGVGELKIYDAAGQATTQASQLETLVQQKPEAILLGVSDSKAVLPQLKAAKAAGIKIVAFNAEVTELPLDGSVVVSERETSHRAGVALLETLKAAGKATPNVLHLIGNLSSESARERAGGFTDAMKEGIEGVKPKVTELVTDYKPEKASSGLQDALTRGDIDGIFVHSDFLTPSLVPVLQGKQLGKVGSDNHVVLGALGGIPGGLKAIRDGWQDYTLNFPIDAECAIATRMAVALVNGKTFKDSWEGAVSEAGLGTGYETKFEEKESGPVLSITARLVTKAEVDDEQLWANRLGK
jgi:ABC-type sugar transport system substrate-binding protein